MVACRGSDWWMRLSWRKWWKHDRETLFIDEIRQERRTRILNKSQEETGEVCHPNEIQIRLVCRMLLCGVWKEDLWTPIIHWVPSVEYMIVSRKLSILYCIEKKKLFCLWILKCQLI